MPFATHPGSLLKRELKARELSANRLALDLSVPSGRLTDTLNGRRSITAGLYFGIGPNPGLSCRASTTLLSSSASAVPRWGVCDLQMRREGLESSARTERHGRWTL